MTLLPELPINCQEVDGRALPKCVPLQGTLLPWQSDFGQCCHCHGSVAGVYRLYRNDRIIYVGVTINLKRRIREHGGIFDRFDFVEVGDAAERRTLEVTLIRKHLPRFNSRDNPIQSVLVTRTVLSKLRAGVRSDQLWDEYGMTASTFHFLRRKIQPAKRNMKTELPKCPFCDYPRESGFICEKCGADLIWMIPWEEGGASLPMLEDRQPPT